MEEGVGEFERIYDTCKKSRCEYARRVHYYDDDNDDEAMSCVVDVRLNKTAFNLMDTSHRYIEHKYIRIHYEAETRMENGYLLLREQVLLYVYDECMEYSLMSSLYTILILGVSWT